MDIIKGKIGNALESVAPDHVVAVASDIYDENKEQYQSDVNDRLDSKTAYAVCTDEADAVTKYILMPLSYRLDTGGSIKIKMVHHNTADNVMLDINGYQKPLFYYGERASATNSWEDGETIEVYYDGLVFQANNVAGSKKEVDDLRKDFTAMNATFSLYPHNSVVYLDSNNANDRRVYCNIFGVIAEKLEITAESLPNPLIYNNAEGTLHIDIGSFDTTGEKKIIAKATFPGGIVRTIETSMKVVDKIYYGPDSEYNSSSNKVKTPTTTPFGEYYNILTTTSKTYFFIPQNMIDGVLKARLNGIEFPLTSAQTQFILGKERTRWDFTTATWDKETGFSEQSMVVGGQPCYRAIGDLDGLYLQGGNGTNWVVNSNGLIEGNGYRYIGISSDLLQTNDIIIIDTTSPIEDVECGEEMERPASSPETEHWFRYTDVSAANDFTFKITRNNYIRSISISRGIPYSRYENANDLQPGTYNIELVNVSE